LQTSDREPDRENVHQLVGLARDIQWPAETEPGEHDRGVDALKIAQLTGHFLVFIASLPLHAETGKGQRMPSFRFAAGLFAGGRWIRTLGPLVMDGDHHLVGHDGVRRAPTVRLCGRRRSVATDPA
jgi:hypothetical protein